MACGRRRAALCALAAAALGVGCARSSAPGASAAGATPDGGAPAGGPDGGGGKGPGALPALGPGGETRWLATVAGPFADGARSVAPDADGGVVVAAAQGTGAPPSAEELALLRVAADGAVSSTRSFGSPCGVAGTVLGAAPDGTLYLEAATACSAVVSGLGPEALPPSGRVYALGTGGEARTVLSGGALGGAVDAQGRLVLLPSTGAAVAVVAADGSQVWQVAVDGAWLVAASPAGGVVVGAAPAGGAPRLVALDAAGGERWARALPDGLDLRHLTVLTDGAVAATGVLSGAAAFGAGQAGAAGERRQVILAVEPDGAPRTLAEVGDATADDPAVQVAPLPHGRVLLLGFPGCDRLRGLDPQLQPVWARTLDASCAATAAAAALTAAGEIAVVGAFRGQADFGGGQVASAQAGSQDGFVLGLAP